MRGAPRRLARHPHRSAELPRRSVPWISYELGRLFHHHHSATSADSLHLDGDELVRFGTRFFVPNDKDLRLMVTRNAHHIIAGHAGRRKTLQLVQRHYWWPGMKEFIRSSVETCEVSIRTKTRRHLPIGEVKWLPVPPLPWSSISMDLVEFLPT